MAQSFFSNIENASEIVQGHTYLDVYGFVMNKKFPGVGSTFHNQSTK